MATQTSQPFEVDEEETAIYGTTIQDEDGNGIAAASLDALTLTLYLRGAPTTIINSRDGQDVLNANNVTVSAAGVLEWTMQPADNEIQTTLNELLEARARAYAQRSTVRQAQRGFDIVTREYLAGTKTRLEVTEADQSLRDSELNYAQAVYDYLVAKAQLDHAIGRVPAVEPVVAAMVKDPGTPQPSYVPDQTMETQR